MKAEWIWYPGDFSLELFNKTMVKRFERDVPIPPFWRMDNCYQNVLFVKKVNFDKPVSVKVKAEGALAIEIVQKNYHPDPKDTSETELKTSAAEWKNYQYGFTDTLNIPAGECELKFSLYNNKGIPCLFVEGDNLVSDQTWIVTANDHEDKQVGTQGFYDINYSPNQFRLATCPVQPVKVYEKNGKTIYDFGREMMSYVQLKNIKKAGRVEVYYGESEAEALDEKHCELTDVFNIPQGETEFTSPLAKAFRYLNFSGDASGYDVSALFEYLPVESKAKFQCNDERLNQIYDVSLYTFGLNTREFFLDGIKRDRWVWSGDATQSYLMDFYSFFDLDICKRTMFALAGKEPYKTHLNFIMDYTFYWLISIDDYYKYTYDVEFIQKIYDKVKGLMEFCIGRTNENGLMVGYPKDWVFVDWADIENRGEVCFEQMVYLISLKKCADIAAVCGDFASEKRWKTLAQGVEIQLEKFWNPQKNAYVHYFDEGKQSEKVTKYANMFAILYDLCSEERKELIAKHVLKNDEIQKITTPFMRFYELAALCEIGEYNLIQDEILKYWGGMLDEGATSFWEAYDPKEKGNEKYAMYGRLYGKSLCHAWGASPLYLIGRYFSGCKPIGKEKYLVEPHLANLEWMKLTVPTVNGHIDIDMTKTKLTVSCVGVDCEIVANGKRCLLERNKEIQIALE